MNANAIIKAALRKLIVVKSGGTPTTAQYADGLEVLNDMVNSWSAQNNLVYEDTLEELSIPASTQSITIGATGTLVTGRPLRIKIATLRDGSIEYEMNLIDQGEYAYIADKTVSGRPYELYYRNTWPNGTIYFNKTSDSAYTLILTSLKQLSTFPDGTTEVSLPDHYERALKTNLTIELADEFGAGNRVTASMVKIAEEARNAIIGQAIDIVPSRTDIPAPGVYNITSDSY